MDTDLRTAQRRDRVAWLRGRVRRGDRAPWACSKCVEVTRCATCRRQPCLPDGKCAAHTDCQGTGRAPFAEAIELAAALGDRDSRTCLGWDDAVPLGVWRSEFDDGLVATCNRLSRWPGALERAALAACEAWLAVPFVTDIRNARTTRRAIEAARAHIAKPTAATRQRCGQFAPAESPAHRLCHFLAWRGEGAPSLGHVITMCGDVRQAIRDSLIGWALA